MVPWLAPVALLIAFVLSFFPWTGVYPSGTSVYTQNAWQAVGGSFTVNALGDEIMKDVWKRETDLDKHSRWSGWMLLYVFLLIVAALLAVAERVVPWIGGTVPDVFRPIWPYRQLIVSLLCAVLFLLLLGALLFGFGLETAAARAAEAAVPPPPPAADGTPPTSSEIQKRNLRRDVILASYALDRTFWLTLAVVVHGIALFGAGLALWLDRHPERSEPRLECYC